MRDQQPGRERSGIRHLDGLALHAELDHAIAAFLQRKRRDASRGPLASEIALFVRDGEAWATITVELGARSSLDGLLLWGVNRMGRILDAQAAAYAEQWGPCSVVRVERRGALFGVSYFITDSGRAPDRDDEAFDVFEILPGGREAEGLGRQDHDSLRIDPTLLESRSGSGGLSALPLDPDRAIAEYVIRTYEQASTRSLVSEFALIARASDGWTTVIVRNDLVSDDVHEKLLWSVNRLARVLRAVAAVTVEDEDNLLVTLQRRDAVERTQRQFIISRESEELEELDDVDTVFYLVPGGLHREGWGWSDHDSIVGPRGSDANDHRAQSKSTYCEGEEG